MLLSLSNAALAHAIGLGVGAATAVSLGTLYMPMSAFAPWTLKLFESF